MLVPEVSLRPLVRLESLETGVTARREAGLDIGGVVDMEVCLAVWFDTGRDVATFAIAFPFGTFFTRERDKVPLSVDLDPGPESVLAPPRSTQPPVR